MDVDMEFVGDIPCDLQGLNGLLHVLLLQEVFHE